MYTSPNMGLTIWNLLSDLFSHVQLEDTFLAIDAHDHTVGHGVQIPTGGIQDGAITTVKLADGSVTTVKIADGAVTGAKLSRPLVFDIVEGSPVEIISFIRTADSDEFASLYVDDTEGGGSPERRVELQSTVPGGGASNAVDTIGRVSANGSDGFGAASGHVQNGSRQGRLYAQDATAASFALVKAEVNVSDVAAVTAFASAASATVINDTDQSSFLQLLAGVGKRRVTFGVASVAYAEGGVPGTATFAHGLGTTPLTVLATPVFLTGADPLFYAMATFDATNIIITMSPIAAGGTRDCSWLAIG